MFSKYFYDDLIVGEINLTSVDYFFCLFQFPNHKILLIEVSETSQQYFVGLQNEMILESSDVKMIPFSNTKDVGLLIYQCVSSNF